MSDLRARLADALREHYLWDEFNNTDGRRARCRCDLTNPSITNGVPDGGWMPFEDYATHVADVLLSLPGIAIVDREDLWDAQQYVQDWRDGDNCDDRPEHQERLKQLARRLRDAANRAAGAAD